MLKKFFTGVKEKSKSMVLKVATAAAGVGALVFAKASSSFAANEDLDTVTGTLVDGAGDMKTNAMTLIVAIIAIIVVVFGISWLIGIFKRNMNKA